jgi:hypothetical protein
VPAFGLTLHQWGDGSYHHMDFGLRNDDGTYMYRSSAALVDAWRTDWGGWTYRYEGTYELSSRPGGTDQMPSSGAYSAELTFSWRETRITSSIVSINEY